MFTGKAKKVFIACLLKRHNIMEDKVLSSSLLVGIKSKKVALPQRQSSNDL